jgi:hypothetical protein
MKINKAKSPGEKGDGAFLLPDIHFLAGWYL